eukprot:COSAG06_NODE_106_length_23773_cov_20.279083_11_plen_138_part_00
MLASDSVYNVTSEPSFVSIGVVANVERHSGSISSQRQGRAASPVLATMLSADGACACPPPLRPPAPLTSSPYLLGRRDARYPPGCACTGSTSVGGRAEASACPVLDRELHERCSEAARQDATEALGTHAKALWFRLG